jgi:hypothetical protein
MTKQGYESAPENQGRFKTAWGELHYLCKKAHYWLYVRRDKASAKRFVGRLIRVLEKLPENKLAIIRQEGLALVHEITDDYALAIKHREEEIRLIQTLHEDVRRSVAAGDYDEKMGTSILAGHDFSALQERRAIVASLQRALKNKG